MIMTGKVGQFFLDRIERKTHHSGIDAVTEHRFIGSSEGLDNRSGKA